TVIALPTTGQGAINGSATAADFDNDGLQDIVVTSIIDTSAYLLLSGNGNNFAANTIPQASGISQSGVAAGDFNKDGFQDLVIGTYQDTAKDFVILRGNVSAGVVSFTRAGFFDTNSQSNSYITSMTTGDFNGDGYLDVAAGSANDQVFVLLNSKNTST